MRIAVSEKKNETRAAGGRGAGRGEGDDRLNEHSLGAQL